MTKEELRQKIKDAIHPCSAHAYFGSPESSFLKRDLDKSVEDVLKIIYQNDQTSKDYD